MNTAMEEAYKHNKQYIRFAEKLCHNPDEAMDIVHDAYIKASRSIREDRNPRSYMYSTIYSVFVDRIRHKDKAVELTDIAARERTDEEIGDDLTRALAELSMEMRDTLLGFVLDEMCYSELAQKYGVPKGTIGSRISKAKSKIKKYLRYGRSKVA